MTKHKNVAEPAVDETVSVQVEEVAVAAVAAPAKSKAFRFEVLAGIHMNGQVPVSQGEVIESDDDLVAIHGNKKFRRVE